MKGSNRYSTLFSRKVRIEFQIVFKCQAIHLEGMMSHNYGNQMSLLTCFLDLSGLNVDLIYRGKYFHKIHVMGFFHSVAKFLSESLLFKILGTSRISAKLASRSSLE